MKQTAVEFLAEQIEKTTYLYNEDKIAIKQAKEMEKEQQNRYSEEDMKKAFINGYLCENKLGIAITFEEWFETVKKK